MYKLGIKAFYLFYLRLGSFHPSLPSFLPSFPPFLLASCLSPSPKFIILHSHTMCWKNILSTCVLSCKKIFFVVLFRINSTCYVSSASCLFYLAVSKICLCGCVNIFLCLFFSNALQYLCRVSHFLIYSSKMGTQLSSNFL